MGVVVNQTVLVAGARSPIGRLLGGLSASTAVDLGALAIAEALARSGVSADAVDHVIMGQVIQAGCGQNPARQAAVRAGIPMRVPAMTVNKVCLSGLAAIAMADQMIRSGEADIVVAGGMESMSNAPHIAAGLRKGQKFGDLELADSITVDALTCAFDELGMGAATELYNARYGVTREQQDQVAAASHARAAAAHDLLAQEIFAVDGVVADEGVRADTSLERLGRLRPAFAEDGTITAGNSSQLSDGAAAVVIASRTAAERLGLSWIAEIVATASTAGPDASLHEQPANAIAVALTKAGLSLADLDRFEINEAFAAVSAVSTERLGADPAKVNVNGGAIALGHPVGMTGARVALHLALELQRLGGGLGAAALCGGGGQGEALLLRVASGD